MSSDRWPPLTTPTPVDGIPEQKHRHDAADIFGIFKNITVAGDIWSSNWDGGHDLTAGRDAVATLGYFLDSSAGAAQFKVIYADGGQLRTLSVTGTLTLSGSGKLETVGGYSAGGAVQAIVLTAAGPDKMTFYSGAGAGEVGAAYFRTWSVVGVPHLSLYGPHDGVNTAGEVDLWPGKGWLYGGSEAGLGATAAGGGTVVMTIDGGAPVFRPYAAHATIDLGSTTRAWEDSYIETMYCDRGDGTYVEAAPRGTLLKYGFNGSATNRTIQGGGADAEIIVTEGGTAITVACEYVGQLVVVDVTIMVTVSGITAGEWWRLVPWVNGAAASGWVNQFNEALSALAAQAHAAGGGIGLGHSAGGTGNTGAAGTGATSSDGGHPHSIPAMSVAGTSGAASAGTAHTHSSGTYAIPAATYNTGAVGNHSHTGPSHTHTGPSHSDHGTHTIADHPLHSHATTYDGTWTGRWVGQATADASKNVVLSIGGCTETTDATLNQHSLAYIVWRL